MDKTIAEGKNMWEEYHPDDGEYGLYCLAIDGFDYNHNIHVGYCEDHFALIYHNTCEDKGSSKYWGAYFSDGDSECFGDLEVAKEISFKILKLME